MSQVPHPRPGRGGVHVDPAGQPTLGVEHHVVRGDVVQADHLHRLADRRLPHEFAPGRSRGGLLEVAAEEAAGGGMDLGELTAGGGQHRRGPHVRGQWVGRHGARQVGQHLPALVVAAQRVRQERHATGVEVVQQSVDGGGPRTCGAVHGLAPASHGGRAAADEDLLVRRGVGGRWGGDGVVVSWHACSVSSPPQRVDVSAGTARTQPLVVDVRLCSPDRCGGPATTGRRGGAGHFA